VSVSRVKGLALVACLAVLCDANVSAWGPDGHRIVCLVAYQLLDAPRQGEIRRLTSVYRNPDGGGFEFFTDGCTFPDEARSKAKDNVPGWDKFDPFESWHFLNVPRTTIRVEDGHCHGNCVLTGIARHTEALANASSDAARAEALFFLGHWLGDIHQPLHISYTDDLGGNGITPITGGFYPSPHLHGVWDSGIIAKAVGNDGWRIYADRLARDITPAERATWIDGQALSWAQESYNLITRPKAQYCAWQNVSQEFTCVGIAGGRALMQSYQGEFKDDVELRLQQAGARLADLLRRHLAVP
jgi:S1/P1 Nuclease